MLSPAERARAGSYASGSRARAFVATRTALRRILGAYLDTAPAAVPLEAERHRTQSNFRIVTNLQLENADTPQMTAVFD